MDRETLSQKISYEISLRNSIWALAIIVIGGAVSLMFHLNTILEKVLCVAGFILSLGLFNGALKKDEYIENLIKQYERNK